jgi:hypothetical protein
MVGVIEARLPPTPPKGGGTPLSTVGTVSSYTIEGETMAGAAAASASWVEVQNLQLQTASDLQDFEGINTPSQYGDR